MLFGTQSKSYTITSGEENCFVANGTTIEHECNAFDCPEECILDYGDWSECTLNGTDKWHTRLVKIGINATWGPCFIDGIDYPFETWVEGVPEDQQCAYCNLHTCNNSRELFDNAIDIYCENDICDDETCCEPSCTDGIQNGDEEDIDCGGTNCEVTIITTSK